MQHDEDGNPVVDSSKSSMKIIRVVREKGSVPSAKLISAKGVNMVSYWIPSMSETIKITYKFVNISTNRYETSIQVQVL